MNFVAIIPAAGLSRRMGEPKLLKDFEGEPLISHVLNAWLASRVKRVIVVVREDDTKLRDHLDEFDVDIAITNPPPEQMKDSVLAGIKYTAEHYPMGVNDAFLLAPADMPYLSPWLIDQVLEQHNPDAAAIIAPSFEGTKGHPTLFPWPFVTGVFQLSVDQGLNALWDFYFGRTFEVQDRSPLVDLDTPEDWQRQ
ncbi:MAG: nucleotidyltransferase family protein [Planctomycetaceae bacterium]